MTQSILKSSFINSQILTRRKRAAFSCHRISMPPSCAALRRGLFNGAAPQPVRPPGNVDAGRRRGLACRAAQDLSEHDGRHPGSQQSFEQPGRPPVPTLWREKAARLRPGSQSAKRGLGSGLKRGVPPPRIASRLRGPIAPRRSRLWLSAGTPIPTPSQASAAFSEIRWRSRVYGPRRALLPHANRTVGVNRAPLS